MESTSAEDAREWWLRAGVERADGGMDEGSSFVAGVRGGCGFVRVLKWFVRRSMAGRKGFGRKRKGRGRFILLGVWSWHALDGVGCHLFALLETIAVGRSRCCSQES